ncbi:MAG: START domain-containing protein [Bacteroidota bacterium]
MLSSIFSKLSLFFLIIALPHSTTVDWKLAKSSNGIEVFTKNDSNSKFRQVRSVVTIEASVATILKTLRTYDYIAEWRMKTKAMSLLEGQPEGLHYLYLVIDLPQPFNDRDFVLELETQVLQDQSIRIDFKAVDGKYPNQKGLIRMQTMEGYWLIEPIDDQSTKLTYEYLSDPSGVPAWIVNLFSVSVPYKTLKKLKEQLDAA